MSFLPIETDRLASSMGEWLSTTGQVPDVVVSCRVRLARNLHGLPFVSRLAPEQAQEVAERVRDRLAEVAFDSESFWVPMEDASPVLRLLLRERHLISRDLAPAEGARPVPPGRAVAFGRSETVSVMVNEEDHLRVQAMAGGFDFESAWSRASALDRELEEGLVFATRKDLGYLTGCPTNVGTGLRASVMLHLPALGLVRAELEKVFTAAQRTGLAVRGMYGEGSRAAGDFYQISNQITLGRSEEQLIDDLRSLVPVIVEFERKLRSALFDNQKAALRDRVCRSLGTLRAARAMPTEDALAHLSNIRLGIHIGLLDDTPLSVLNELGVQIQRGHVQALSDTERSDDHLLDVSERDKLRAEILRKRLAQR